MPSKVLLYCRWLRFLDSSCATVIMSFLLFSEPMRKGIDYSLTVQFSHVVL